MRKLEWSNPAIKDMRKLDKPVRSRITSKVEEWAKSNPSRHKQLEDTDDLYVYRVGDYRVIYELYSDSVFVVQVLGRGDSYKRHRIWRNAIDLVR